jgi:hypothetical protein
LWTCGRNENFINIGSKHKYFISEDYTVVKVTYSHKFSWFIYIEDPSKLALEGL